MEMYKYEMKKIWSKRSNKIILLILIIYIFAALFFTIKENSTYIDLQGNEIKGLNGISQLKKEKLKSNGEITEDVIKNVIRKKREINKIKEFQITVNGYSGLNDKGYSRTQEFEDIRNLINSSFNGFGSYNYYTIDNLKDSDAELFYTNRINDTKSWVEGQNLNSIKKNYFINSVNEFKTPIKYSYMDGWSVLFEFLSIILYALAVVLCIFAAQIFGIEYQNDADDIFLTTKYGKGKAIRTKILSSILTSSTIYWGIVLLFSVVILSIYGFNGGNLAIQANGYFWTSFYNVTNIQAFCMINLLGYIGCLFMSSLTLFLSIKMKSSFGSIIIPFIIIMVPTLFGDMGKNNILEKIIDLLPHKMLQGQTLLFFYDLFNIGNKVFTPYEYFTIIYILLIFIILSLCYKSFKKQQVN